MRVRVIDSSEHPMNMTDCVDQDSCTGCQGTISEGNMIFLERGPRHQVSNSGSFCCFELAFGSLRFRDTKLERLCREKQQLGCLGMTAEEV